MAAAQIFFLRGMQKSGTKWMGNLLNLHPRILCRGEYHFGVLDDAIKRWHQINGLTRSLGEAATQNLTAFIERSVTSNPSKPDIVWFGDRTPGEIDRGVLPDAPRIFLLRDGRDILVSRTYHYLRLGLQLPHCSP